MNGNTVKIILSSILAILIFFVVISGCTAKTEENQSFTESQKPNVNAILALKNVQTIDKIDKKYPKPGHKFVVITTTLDPGVVTGKVIDVGSFKEENVNSPPTGASSPGHSSLWMTFGNRYESEQQLSQIATLETDANSLYRAYGKEYYNLQFANSQDLFGGGYYLVKGTTIALIFELPIAETPKSITIPYFIKKENSTDIESVVISLL